MVVGEASIHNIMGGMTSTGGVRLHNHKRKLKQRFDIIKKLGQGTYGKVQLGINKETGQEVAIKTIKKCKIETEADLIRIRREIQIMSSVQHPNIIHIYEVFENREKMVLVMEYAAGGELYDYLSERKVLTEQEARRIFRQIATAVFYCHKHKICHRDLKLENILLDQVGNAKIADFGLSNVFDEQRLLNTFCGSPLYASPEIVKGTPYHGPEVDCWSLGVLLYTLVYGAMPFDGSNFKRLVKQISQSDYFEPKKPSPASPLIKDMLTVLPSKRADIERICTHWWVNEGYQQNCLEIAEELAAQTPVRLDLLLSLVPQSASAEKLVVGDQQTTGDVANSVSSETLVPTRCHSVGSLMELDRDDSDRRIRELLDEEPRSSPAGGEAKRKLETTPSMDETAAAGAKRKDRPRRKEKHEERDTRVYKAAPRHHSAPIPNSIAEEAMEVDPVAAISGDSVDPSQPDTVPAACLELIKECHEVSPSKERSETPVIHGSSQQSLPDGSMPAVPIKYEQSQEQRTLDEEHRSKTFDQEGMKSPEVGVALPSPDRTIPPVTPESETFVAANDVLERTASASHDAIDLEETRREFKKLKEKALSLDSELSTNEARDVPAKTFERRRSKIFETAEKFNQMASNVENEKPKKIFIPGVNVGGAKRVFERKASLSSICTPPPAKAAASKVIIDVSPTSAASSDKSKQPTRNEEGSRPDEERQKSRKTKEEEEEAAKKRAVDIITGAIGKPPVQKRANGSPPVSPSSQEPRRLPLKIPIGANDSRTATVTVSTPVDTKFPFDDKTAEADARLPVLAAERSGASDARPEHDGQQPEEPKMSSKMEITLKSATLPRQRKTSKAEISLSGVKYPGREMPAAFKSEVEAKIDAFHPQRLRTQRSEVAFPVAAAVPQTNRSSSLEPESRSMNAAPRERIIPIQVEADHRRPPHSSTPPPSKPPPMPQRSASLSRQSTADSDTDSALGSAIGPEPIRKSPREYIIPIAVEGGGYVTPRSGSVEPESKAGGTSSTANAPRSRFGRPRRMSSLLSDASEDESPFSSLHRDSEDLLQRHMHRLRSSRPSRQPPEHADSLSSGEDDDDDDDDGFELLTAENLFSTLLSRVRSLTQRLNVDDNRGAGFPSSRLFGRLGANASQPFWGMNKPLSRRLSESQFRHSLGRDADTFSRKDLLNASSNPDTPSGPASRGASPRDTVFDVGSNTLPRDTIARDDVETEPRRARKGAEESLEQSFTPSLARRLSRTLIEQTRRSLARSPSVSYESRGRSPGPGSRETSEAGDRSVSTASTVSDPSEYKERPVSGGRVVRRANSLLEPVAGRQTQRDSPRRSVSLFDDEAQARDYDEKSGRAFALGRWYKDPGRLRKDSFRSYRTEKIQEESADDAYGENNADSCSVSEHTSVSVCDSNTNLLDATSSLSTKSYETSPTESSSNIGDYKAAYRSDLSRNFEDRLLAAENLIKESKLKNLGLPGGERFDPNLSSSYRDTDKCDKRSLMSIAEASGGASLTKRRSCIPSLRLRSGSLTRDPCGLVERGKSTPESGDGRALSPEKSLLGKLFKAASGTRDADAKQKEEKTKSKQRRISRFLRPDFFDTPREESRYVKEKEAQKAAENERRKSRFIRRKTESEKAAPASGRGESAEREKRREKELKNEINNSLRREQCSQEAEERSEGAIDSGAVVESSRNGFLHSLEKKLERFRSAEGQATSEPGKEKTAATVNGQASRERSAPPVDRRGESDAAGVKRAISVEDLSPARKSGEGSTRSRVSSVLGLFKSAEGKHLANGARSQTAAAGKPKRSPTKKMGDPTVAEDAAPSSCGSKIPTKNLGAEPKTAKKMSAKRSGSSVADSPKRSPAKDGPEKLDREPSKERSTSGEKQPERNPEDTDATSARAKKPNRSSVENGSSSVELPEKSQDADKTARKPLKKLSATSASGETSDNSKKKRIVRVVKKVTKKSGDSAGTADGPGKSPTDEKEKSSKTRVTKKKSVEPNGSAAAPKNGKARENGVAGVDDQTPPSEDTKNGKSSRLRESQRANRGNLKLDLSKILPQPPFRNATARKGSPKSSEPGPDKSTESTSKVAHRGAGTGTKIAVDKPLRAKDVAELKKEVTECARIIESRAESATVPPPPNPDAEKNEGQKQEATTTTTAAAGSPENRRASCVPKECPTDYANDPLSPMDEPESFDSWSISSAELSHAHADLHSPTSPSHSLFAKTDSTESVIDRIRRRSFYTRFNDRRRPSLTAPPPGVPLPSSATLPRKFSFAGQHRDRSKYAAGYGLTGSGKADRGYSLYGDDDDGVRLGRNRSLDRGRYSDSSDHPSTVSSVHDPLRRYLRSPTFDLSASRPRYHSADFTADPDLATCYRPHLNSLLNDTATEGRTTSAFSSLPRKYGTRFAEPKTVEYYEDLLAPSCADYLPSRRSPASEYLEKSENGYHNGNLELRSTGSARKSCAESPTTLCERLPPVGSREDESVEPTRGKGDPAS